MACRTKQPNLAESLGENRLDAGKTVAMGLRQDMESEMQVIADADMESESNNIKLEDDSREGNQGFKDSLDVP
jgi:hypothetical protein